MPLKFGFSKPTISKNIAEEMRAGKKPAQASAIAFSLARKAKSKGYFNGGMAGEDDYMSKDELLESLYRKNAFAGANTKTVVREDYPDDLEEMEEDDISDEEPGPPMEHVSANEGDERKKLLSSVFVRRFMRR